MPDYFAVMDSSSTGFSFKWNTYSDHLRSMLHSLLSSPDSADVTLVCDDQKQLRAHKAILSYCSPIFKIIIQSNPHPHPLIYLRGVKYETLQSLINFMYVGKASLDKDHVNQFLEIAKEFEIKELCQSQGIENATERTNNSSEEETVDESKDDDICLQQKEGKDDRCAEDNVSNQDIFFVDTEHTKEAAVATDNDNVSNQMEDDQTNDISEQVDCSEKSFLQETAFETSNKNDDKVKNDMTNDNVTFIHVNSNQTIHTPETNIQYVFSDLLSMKL